MKNRTTNAGKNANMRRGPRNVRATAMNATITLIWKRNRSCVASPTYIIATATTSTTGPASDSRPLNEKDRSLRSQTRYAKTRGTVKMYPRLELDVTNPKRSTIGALKTITPSARYSRMTHCLSMIRFRIEFLTSVHSEKVSIGHLEPCQCQMIPSTTLPFSGIRTPGPIAERATTAPSPMTAPGITTDFITAA